MRMNLPIGILVLCTLMVAISGCGGGNGNDVGGTNFPPGTFAGESSVNPKDGAEMVWVPAGSFYMGTGTEEAATLQQQFSVIPQDMLTSSSSDEKPRHQVTLDGYWIYKTEVTVGRYRAFCQATGRSVPTGEDWDKGDSYPATAITYTDAVAYARWAGVSLPTEAQWEKAARGSSGTQIFPWGNDWDMNRVAINITAVGSHPSGVSPYGALDMLGNASEWCVDYYQGNYYQQSPSQNPTGPNQPSEQTYIYHSVRGNIFNYHSFSTGTDTPYASCMARWYSSMIGAYTDQGFRCASKP